MTVAARRPRSEGRRGDGEHAGQARAGTRAGGGRHPGQPAADARAARGAVPRAHRRQRPGRAAGSRRRAAPGPDPARCEHAGHGRLRGLPTAQGRSADPRHPVDVPHCPRRSRRRATGPGPGRGGLPGQAGEPADRPGAGAYPSAIEGQCRFPARQERIPGTRSAPSHAPAATVAGRRHRSPGDPWRSSRQPAQPPSSAYRALCQAARRAPGGAAGVRRRADSGGCRPAEQVGAVA